MRHIDPYEQLNLMAIACVHLCQDFVTGAHHGNCLLEICPRIAQLGDVHWATYPKLTWAYRV